MSSLVTIATYNRQYEASLAQARLSAKGIRSVIHGENTARVFQGFGGELGSIQLRVMKDDEDAARAILSLDEFSDMDDEEGDEFLAAIQAEAAGEPEEREKFTGRTHCPRCGSDNLFTNEYSPLAILGAILLLGIPFFFMKRERECAICGMKFKL